MIIFYKKNRIVKLLYSIFIIFGKNVYAVFYYTWFVGQVSHGRISYNLQPVFPKSDDLYAKNNDMLIEIPSDSDEEDKVFEEHILLQLLFLFSSSKVNFLKRDLFLHVILI